jgi:DNA-binding NtrC family response regulator
VLIVDGDPSARSTVRSVVEENGMRALTAATAQEALGVVTREPVDLVLLDVRLPDKSGLDLLRDLKAREPDLGVIVFTEEKAPAIIVEAIKLGALDYLTKDHGPAELKSQLSKPLHDLAQQHEFARRSAEAEAGGVLPLVSGTSALMTEVLRTARQVASLPTTVLISGESGTGKEALACFIHQLSDRKNGPFVPVDLPALALDYVDRTLFGLELPGRGSMGRFELADTGTIFLDEISALTAATQSRLLRVVQEREVSRLGASQPIKLNFRLICATRLDLQALVAAGKFSEDLYFRLAVQPIEIPPLRQRVEDIEALSTYFLADFAQRYRRSMRSLAPDALETLRRHSWRGNVRELRNLMERLAISSETEIVTVADLPEELRRLRPSAASNEPTLDEAVATFEAEQIARALKQTRGDKKAAAARLGIGYSTLRTKLRQYDLSEND